jgi:2-iminobutanoate/2-iminopropanoate deaminase
MSRIQSVASDAAPAAVGAYSPAVVADGWCFVSGQIGWNADGTGLAERSPAEQTEQALRNVEALLEAAGASLRDVVRTTIYIGAHEMWGEINEAYERVLRDAGVDVLPARTAVPAAMPFAVEIDVIASVPR